MKNTYEKVIELIEKEFKGNYKHEIEGKKYIIEMLKEEEHLCRNKYNGKASRLDVTSIFESLVFILRTVNKETNPELDKDTERYVVRTLNKVMQVVYESKKYGFNIYENDYK